MLSVAVVFDSLQGTESASNQEIVSTTVLYQYA